MQANILKKLIPGFLIAVALVVAMSGSALAVSNPARAPHQPVKVQRVAAPITINLYALTGSVSLAGGAATAPIWGFSTSSLGPAELPGPKMEAVVGDVVTINLTNVNVPGSVSLDIPGSDLVPDATGVTAGNATAYVFTATRPGTYLYRSGVDPATQTAMGLYGTLIVRPATAGQAYDDASTAYDVEQVMVLSEIDVELNTAIDNGTFGTAMTMLDYRPDYWLINGQAYPDTSPVVAASGDQVLFRYLNAGSREHTMQLMGMDQMAIAEDAFPHPFAFHSFSPAIAAGQTQDLIATMPTVTSSQDFALFNREQYITNAGAYPGGMISIVQVSP